MKNINKICPTDSTHNRFIARALLPAEWLVDRNGKFIEVMEEADRDVEPKFDPKSIWMCLECGTPAVDVTTEEKNDGKVSR